MLRYTYSLKVFCYPNFKNSEPNTQRKLSQTQLLKACTAQFTTVDKHKRHTHSRSFYRE